MGVSFPTGKTGQGLRGYPTRPRADTGGVCHCREQFMPDQDDICQRCGRFPQNVIDQTWHQRARKVQLVGALRKAKAKAKAA